MYMPWYRYLTLWVLQDKLKFNICELPTSHLKNSDMPGLAQRLDKHVPLYLRYCCSHWADHLVVGHLDSETEKNVLGFLETNFLFWLEVQSLLGRMSQCPVALAKVLSWSKVRRV